jgi:hypothetical protein
MKKSSWQRNEQICGGPASAISGSISKTTIRLIKIPIVD